LEVLKSGLERLRAGDEEGGGTVRRMGQAFLTWAIAEGLEPVEAAAFSVVRAEKGELLQAARELGQLIEQVVDRLRPDESEHLTILVAEDNPDDLLLMEVALHAPGRSFQTCPSGEEALSFLDRQDVALLVLDIMLPDMDGRALLAQVREMERYQKLPILVVSGKEGAEVEAECHALGATAFFRKPLDPSAIGAAASGALHREAQRRIGVRSDPLTHLLNRKALTDLWERWTFPRPSSVGVIGIDRFRDLEERFNYEVADGVLAAVGRLLRKSIPRGSVGSRWEEAEFLVLFPGWGLDRTRGHLEEILDRVRELEHRDPRGETFRLTASAGVAEVGSEANLESAVAEARGRLEEAKREGGDALGDAPEAEAAQRILVAEDDPLSAAILIDRLEREGFELHHYPDGAQALEGALSEPVDLAVLDVKMPEMDGFELLERLRKVPRYFNLPIIMLTSMGRDEDIARGFELGADDYMVKPFSPTEVLARIRRLLER
jgi:diguanylate cyclase (GGDEF)-like protein